ncbi:peptidase, S54 (rhomboid) family, putative [Verrucomicrobiia bacterium DG1235]|nr:peptidase, S54 (rhomboid) family, putative [Verrucomicrobiae bacterium DG1235]
MSDRYEEEESDYAVIGSYPTAAQAHDAGLTALACGQPYWVEHVEGRYLLVVSRNEATRLRKEVAATERTNRFWPPRSLDISAPSLSKLPTVAFVAVLVFVFWAQNQYPDLKELGMNSSEAVVQDGEWWRIVTAVTLHGDIGHLAGNLMGISIFAYLCCRYMGNGLAWFSIILAASLANFTNALLNAGESYSSLGASTAVFASLGILAGFPVGAYFRSKEPIQSRDWLVPFFGGCVLFAWMGGGDFPTDVAGHFWSFGYGIALAISISWTALHAKLKQWQQFLFLSLVGLALSGCWARAIL